MLNLSCHLPAAEARFRYFSSSSSDSGSDSPSGGGGDKKTSGANRSGAGGSGTGSKNAKGGDKNQLCCPKCGDPCTHVETFVCKYTNLKS